MDAARARPVIFAPVAWIGLAAAYLVFAGQVSAHEVMAGLGASVVAAIYATVAHGTTAPLRLRLLWLRLLGGVAASLVLDTIRVGFSLIRAVPGSLARERLPAADAGQRAVKILALSAAPNGFVVRAEGTDMLLHRLVAADSAL